MMNYSNTEEQLARAAFFLGNIHNVNASIFSMSNRSNLESKFKSDKINNEDAKAGKSLISGELKEWISATLDFIPLIGNIKSGVEAIFGVDPITGRKLKKWEQALSAAAIIGGPAAKAAKHAGKLAVKGGKTLQQQGGKLVQQGGKLVEKGGNLLGKAADLLDSSRTQLAGAGAGLGKFSVSTGISAGKKTTGGSKQVGNSTKQTTSSKPTQQGSQNIKSDKQQTNKQVREVKYGEHIITGKNGRKELAPNVRYVTEDGYKYTTDEFGRIVEVEADNLILKTAERKPHMQRVAGREDRLPEDQGFNSHSIPWFRRY